MQIWANEVGVSVNSMFYTQTVHKSLYLDQQTGSKWQIHMTLESFSNGNL